MIIPDKKKIASVILEKMGKPPIEAAPEDNLDPSMEGLKASAEDILGAIQSKSPSDLVSALKSFLDQHESSEDEPEAEGPEE